MKINRYLIEQIYKISVLLTSIIIHLS